MEKGELMEKTQKIAIAYATALGLSIMAWAMVGLSFGLGIGVGGSIATLYAVSTVMAHVAGRRVVLIGLGIVLGLINATHYLGLQKTADERRLLVSITAEGAFGVPELEAEADLHLFKREVIKEAGKKLADELKKAKSNAKPAEVAQIAIDTYKASIDEIEGLNLGPSIVDKAGEAVSGFGSASKKLIKDVAKSIPTVSTATVSDTGQSRPAIVPTNATRWELSPGERVVFEFPQEFWYDNRPFYVWDRTGKRFTVPDDGKKLRGKMAGGRHFYEGGPEGNVIWTWPSP